MVERLVGLGKLVVVQVGVHLGAHFLGAVQDPAVRVRERLAGRQLIHVRAVHQRELGGVEQLGGEVAGGGCVVLADGQIHARIRAAGQGEAQRVRAVLLHPVHRVDAVAQGLGHLAALFVAHQAVQVKVLERNLRAAVGALPKDFRGFLAGEGAEHHHARHPEEQDVVGGDQHGGGEELLQLRGLLRPAHRGKRPQGRREPGVQHVRVLLVACRRLLVGADADHVALAVFVLRAVPDRDAVAPPQLARDSPVVHVVHPVEVALLHGLRVDDGVAGAHGVAGHLRQLVDLDKPLQRKPRLDRLAGALRVAHGVHVRAHFLDNAALLRQRLAHGYAGLFAGHAVEAGAGIGDAALLVHHDRHVQVVAQAHLVVVRVVRRGDLHRTGAQLHVHVIVRDDLKLQILAQRVLEDLADEVRVALVFRVHGDSDVAKHCLHTGGGNDQVRLVVVERAVADGDELALDVLVHHLDVGDSSLQHRRPVDQAVVAVDQPAVVELLEDGLHGAREAVVKREALARPVHRVADGAHLRGDSAAVLLFPLPDALDELLAPVVVAVLALFRLELGLHLGLGGNAGVVHARQPKHLEALHALAAHQRIHQRVVERVAHVQLAGHVRRRQHDRVRGLVRLRIRREIPGVDPAFVQVAFVGAGLPRLGQLVRAVQIVRLSHAPYLNQRPKTACRRWQLLRAGRRCCCRGVPFGRR